MDCYEYFLSVPLIKLWRSNAMSCYNFVQFLTEKLALPLKEGLVHLTEAFTCMKLTTDFSNVVKKEIKPVTPKGNQSWIFIGRTDAKAKAPMLQPPDAKDWLTEKDPDAGKDWKWEEKGMSGLDGITTRWTGVWANSERDTEREDREAWRAAVRGVARPQTLLNPRITTPTSGVGKNVK